jgi:hypothetical protein
MAKHLTPLERACIEAVVHVHWPQFKIEALRVANRENTGVGQYVYIIDLNQQQLPDGVFEAGGRMIEMEGLHLGLDFALTVETGQLQFLELIAPGSGGWDGVERPWKLL